jgi:hypothetical protein
MTEDERHACRRAAGHVRAIAAGLKGLSDKDAITCDKYASTLEAITGSAEEATISDDQKIDIEQSSFLLEGIRNGLDNADLDTGAEMVQRDIERLNDLVFRFNSQAGN